MPINSGNTAYNIKCFLSPIRAPLFHIRYDVNNFPSRNNPNKIRIFALYQLKSKRFESLTEYPLKCRFKRDPFPCGIFEVKRLDILIFTRQVHQPIEIRVNVIRINFEFLRHLHQSFLDKDCIFGHCFGELLPCFAFCQKRLPKFLLSSFRFFNAISRGVPDSNPILAAVRSEKVNIRKVAVYHIHHKRACFQRRRHIHCVVTRLQAVILVILVH